MAAVAVVAAVAGCGSSRQYETDPRGVLAEAKRALDSAPGLHFGLTSSSAVGSGTLITGADGDAHRPDGFRGTLTLLQAGFNLTVHIISATATMADRDRMGSEELYEIDVSLPGDRVAALLTSADKTQPVKGRIGINVDTHQIRRVVLTGPFFDAHRDSTYTLVLDRYGENVSITPPA